MNKTLIKVIVQNLAFLELSGDDIINPDAAVRAIESVATELDALTDREKAMFSDFVGKLADEEERAGQPQERVEFIRSIPEALGLADGEE